MPNRVRAAGAVTCVLLCAVATASHGARRGLRRLVPPAASPAPAGSGPSLGFPHAIVAGPSGSFFVADKRSSSGWTDEEGAIVRIDADGTRTVLADRAHGSGPLLRGMDLFLEPDGRLLYGLKRVDPATGNWVALPSSGPHHSPSFSEPATLLAGDVVYFAGATALLRQDRATGIYALASGCLLSNNCVLIGTGPLFGGIDVIAPWTDDALLVGGGAGITGVDLATGDRTLLSGTGRGTGPSVYSPDALVVEPSGNILAGVEAAILRIDPATGDRTVVSGPTTGAGPLLRNVEGMALEPGGTVVVADRFLGAVVRVDLTTGDRVLVSGGPAGNGPLPQCARAAELEASGTIVMADCHAGILRLDPETGDRTVVSDSATGTGPQLVEPFDIAVEPSGTLLVFDDEWMKRVHPVTGNRTWIPTPRRNRIRSPKALAVESARSAIVADNGDSVWIPVPPYGSEIHAYSGLQRVDLVTGRTTMVAGGGFFSTKRGEGTSFLGGVYDVARISPTTAASWLHGQLFAVDLVTGDRTLISGTDRGAGPEFLTAHEVAVDASGAWWVVSGVHGLLWRVDPESGDRTLVSSNDHGRGPLFDSPMAVLPTPDGGLLVVNGGSASERRPWTFSVMRVDPVTGDRTILSRP